MTDFVSETIKNNKKIIRFFISGFSATVINIFLLFFFTEIFGLWYIYSSVIAFLSSFFASFFLQKYWTFQDKRANIRNRQMFSHFSLAILNLNLNTLGLYLLVDFFSVYYILAQVLVAGVIAIETFLIFNLLIFKKTENENSLGSEQIQS